MTMTKAEIVFESGDEEIMCVKDLGDQFVFGDETNKNPGVYIDKSDVTDLVAFLLALTGDE